VEQGEPQPSGVRFVAPGERLRIWLKLDMSEDGQPADLFQVGGHPLCFRAPLSTSAACITARNALVLLCSSRRMPHCRCHLHVSSLVVRLLVMCARQVIGELQTLTGKPIARSSRPCVFHPESRLHRLVRSTIPSYSLGH